MLIFPGTARVIISVLKALKGSDLQMALTNRFIEKSLFRDDCESQVPINVLHTISIVMREPSVDIAYLHDGILRACFIQSEPSSYDFSDI